MKKRCLHIAAYSFIAVCLATVLTGCGTKYKQNANVMLVNAATDLPNIDYYLQGTPRAKFVPFGYNTAYYMATKEDYEQFTTRILNSSDGSTIFDIATSNFVDNGKYSLFVYGKIGAPKYKFFNDLGYKASTGDKVKVRFIHMAPDVDSVDFYMYDTLNIAMNRTYFGKDSIRGYQDFKELPILRNPDTLTVYRRGASFLDTVILQPITWEKGKLYTIYLKGYRSGNGVRSIGLGVIKNN